MAEEGLGLVSDDSAIRAVCEEVLAESPNEVAAYKGGKVTLIGWFVGGVMKKMRGKADAALARKILEELFQVSRSRKGCKKYSRKDAKTTLLGKVVVDFFNYLIIVMPSLMM